MHAFLRKYNNEVIETFTLKIVPFETNLLLDVRRQDNYSQSNHFDMPLRWLNNKSSLRILSQLST